MSWLVFFSGGQEGIIGDITKWGGCFRNLCPSRYKDVGSQNCYFISHTLLKEGKRSDAAVLLSGFHICFDCVL